MILRYTLHGTGEPEMDDLAILSRDIVAIAQDECKRTGTPVAVITLYNNLRFVVRDVKRDAIAKWEAADNGYGSSEVS